MNKHNTRMILLGILGMMLQNAAAYVAWSEMWAWQQALTLLAFGLVLAALIRTR